MEVMLQPQRHMLWRSLGNNNDILSHDWVGELWVSSANTTELITGLRSHQWILGRPEKGQGGAPFRGSRLNDIAYLPKIVQSQEAYPHTIHHFPLTRFVGNVFRENKQCKRSYTL